MGCNGDFKTMGLILQNFYLDITLLIVPNPNMNAVFLSYALGCHNFLQAAAGRVWDKVLLDAPCSGTGVLAKRADLRWRRTQQDTQQLVALQVCVAETCYHCRTLIVWRRFHLGQGDAISNFFP
jgi:hypothetical protein